MAGRHVLRTVVLAALVLAISAVTQAAAAPTTLQRVVGLERELLGEMNAVRAARGLHPLTVAPGLRASALSHSRAMLAHGFFAHESPDGTAFSERIKRTYAPRPSGFWAVGENLYSSSVQPTAANTVRAWLASPPHRGILLSAQYRDVGIGVVRSTLAGGEFGDLPTWVVTADFGSRAGRSAAGAKSR